MFGNIPALILNVGIVLGGKDTEIRYDVERV